MRGISVAVGQPTDVPADMDVHRLGGADLANLRLSPLDRQLNPPGISVLLGGTPQEAAGVMRKAFPKSRKWTRPQVVATSSGAKIRAAGFEVVPDPTTRFPNHGRLIHPSGLAGFTDANLQDLAKCFHETLGC